MNLLDLTRKIHSLDVYTRRNVNDLFAGTYKSSFKGQGLEFADVRRYEEGDDARHIDWITSAKQGTLYTKQFVETRELTTMLLVDLSASLNFGTTGRTKQETVIHTAATLLFSALQNNDQFGIILFTDRIVSYIPPKKGKTHLLRILRTLITEYEQNAYTSSQTKKAIRFFSQVTKRKCVCFLLTDTYQPEAEHALRVANARHDMVFVQVSDPFEHGEVPAKVLHGQDLETGTQALINLRDERVRERFRTLRQTKYNTMKESLKQRNIDLLELSTRSNIYSEMLQFFRKRKNKK